MKYQRMEDVDNGKVREVINILEVSIGECETIIPSDTLQDAIDF